MARAALRLCLSILIFAAVAEGAVRVIKPTVRFQVVRPAEWSVELFDVQGTPVWREVQPGNSAAGKACRQQHPDAPVTALYGSSIFYGSGVDRHEVFSELMQAKSGAERCYVNYAQPAYTLQTKLARARHTLPDNPGADVLLEVWQNDGSTYSMLGNAAYSLRSIPVDRQGYPASLGLPAPINGWMFRSLRSYEYASLAVAKFGHEPTGMEAWRDGVIPQLTAFHGLVTANGGTLRLVFMPALDQPLVDQIAPGGFDVYGLVRDWADARGVEWLQAAVLLQDQDVEDIRYDPCCHLNVAGHQLLAERLAPLL